VLSRQLLIEGYFDFKTVVHVKLLLFNTVVHFRYCIYRVTVPLVSAVLRHAKYVRLLCLLGQMLKVGYILCL